LAEGARPNHGDDSDTGPAGDDVLDHAAQGNYSGVIPGGRRSPFGAQIAPPLDGPTVPRPLLKANLDGSHLSIEPRVGAPKPGSAMLVRGAIGSL
jgi:hypothetical protein